MRKLLIALLCVSGISFGTVAPQFQGELLNGGKISLHKALKPNRALLLCFWASWCTPCMQELKTVMERIKTDPSLPLDILTVNVDTMETASDVKPTLKLYKFDFPVVLDPRHEIFSKYQDANTLPFSALIKPNGEIASTFSGYHEEMFTKVKEIVGSRLKENNGQTH